jgi:uncharacterized Zn finger protein (UPF0148 family)
MVGCKCILVKWYYGSRYCPAHYPKVKKKEDKK